MQALIYASVWNGLRPTVCRAWFQLHDCLKSITYLLVQRVMITIDSVKMVETQKQEDTKILSKPDYPRSDFYDE